MEKVYSLSAPLTDQILFLKEKSGVAMLTRTEKRYSWARKPFSPIVLFLGACLGWAPFAARAVTLIPLNAGMQMTCQFVNNTGGQYQDSQIYVVAIGLNSSNQYCHLDANGNMVPCNVGENGSAYALALGSMQGLQFPPVMTSSRLYVSLGSPLSIPINGTPGNVGIAYPDINNPTDANINKTFDWIEFNVGNNLIFCNTTQVDMFGIPMLMDLYDNSPGGYTLNGSVGITEPVASIDSEYAASVPSPFQTLEQPYRIVAPIHGSFAVGQPNAGYFDAYIAAVWNQYRTSDLVITLNQGTFTGRVGSDNRLAFTTPGDPAVYYVSEPTTNDVWGGAGALAQGNSVELALEAQICAGFHRHVIDNAANMNNPAAYYLSAPADFFAQFWHEHNLNAKAYGFCYDDVQNQSSSLIGTGPRGIVLTIGGGAGGSPTPTPTPVIHSTWRVVTGGPAYTDSQGHLWAADENYSGGTAAAPFTGAITGAKPGAGDQSLYQSERYGNPFTYSFNVPPGSYQVTLKFSENYWTAAGQRLFNVSIDGTQVLTNFDIFAAAGGAKKAVDEVFDNIAPSGGVITLQFGPASLDNAKVDAIQIIPEPATPTYTLTPTRTFTPTNSFTKTYTATWTFTSTLSKTPTLTPTSTPTATRTMTSSASATATNTPSVTPTLSWTASGTPTSSLTRTSTVSATPTASSTNSRTPTASSTSTASPTASATASGTSSFTPTSSWTVSSTPTRTSTLTATLSFTPTWTPSPTATKTFTATGTYTNSPSLTPTSTSTASATPTSTGTPSFTPSATSTASGTPTTALTLTFTPSNTPSPSQTPTSTPTLIGTPTPTATLPVPNASPVVYPNPWNGTGPLKLSVDLTQGGTVVVKLVTPAFRKAWQGDFEGLPAGNNELVLNLPRVANGIYYLVVEGSGKQWILKLLILG